MIIAAFWLGLLGAVAVVVITKRHREVMPLTAIAEAPDAKVVRIRGKIIGDLELRAPLSGRPCTYYFVHILAAPYNRRNQWRFADARAFAIADDTGRATIPAADFEVPADIHQLCRFSQLSPRTQTALGQLGIAVADTTEVTIYEAIIGEGEEVEVTGAGMRRIGPGDAAERGFRDRPAGVYELSGAIHVLGERRPMRPLD